MIRAAGVLVKRCTKCGEEKPLSSFNHKKTGKDGLSTSCRVCRSLQNKEWRESNPERVSANLKEWRARNPDRVKRLMRGWLEANKERKKRTDKEYYEANKDRRLAADKARRDSDPKRFKHQYKRYYEDNREKRTFAVRKREQNLATINELIPGQWRVASRVYGGKCLFPGCEETNLTMDHVLPLSKGGRHHISNLQPLCSYHNDSKSTRHVDYRAFVITG